MLNIEDLNDDQKMVLQKAYVIVDALLSRAHLANFHLTVMQAEASQSFHEIVDRIKEAGIKPEEFIAVHALAQCGMQIREMPPSEMSESLENFLFDTAEKLMGPDITAYLREWVDNAHAEPADLSARGPWAQLGALSRASSYLGLYSTLDAEFFAEHAAYMSDLSRDFHAVADATHALAPANAYFNQQIAAFDRMLPSSQPT